MAVVAKLVRFSVGTGDSSGKVVTGVGFQPQVVILVGGKATSTSHPYTCDGVTDGTSQYCISTGILDAASQTSARRYANNDRVLHFVSQDGSDHGAFALASLDSDGFTLTTTTTPVSSFEVAALCIAGLDNVKLDIFQVPAVGVAQFSRTGIGFLPDAIFYLAAINGSLGSTGASTSARIMGWSLKEGAQFAVGMRVVGGGTTSDYTSSVCATDRVLHGVTASGSVNGHDMAMVSHDADGYTLDALNNQNGLYMAALCLKGGVWKAGTITADDAAGDVATTGCNPVAVLMRSSTISTASRSSPFEGGALSVGMADASAQSVQHVLSANRETVSGGQPTEEYTVVDDTALWAHYERTGANTQTAVGEVSLTSLGTEKFTLAEDTSDPSAILIGWLAVGNAPAGGGGSSGHGPLIAGRRNRLILT